MNTIIKREHISRYLIILLSTTCLCSASNAAKRRSKTPKNAPRSTALRKLKPASSKKVTVRKTTRRFVGATTNVPGNLTNYQEQSRQRAIQLVKQAADAFERGDYKSTVELCKIANDAYPTYSRSYTWMGAAYQKIGNKDEACRAFRWVVALSPNTPDADRAQRGLREMGYYNP